MKIVDEYVTADGRMEYRVMDNNGVILPPMSFIEPQKEEAIQAILDERAELEAEQPEKEEKIEIPLKEYTELQTVKLDYIRAVKEQAVIEDPVIEVIKEKPIWDIEIESKVGLR